MLFGVNDFISMENMGKQGKLCPIMTKIIPERRQYKNSEKYKSRFPPKSDVNVCNRLFFGKATKAGGIFRGINSGVLLNGLSRRVQQKKALCQ